MTEGRVGSGQGRGKGSSKEGRFPPSIKLPYPLPTTSISVLWGPRVIKLVEAILQVVLEIIEKNGVTQPSQSSNAYTVLSFE